MKKIAIVGTRGIPAKYGGFETFAQELSVRLAKMNIEVEVYCNCATTPLNNYGNVKLRYASCSKDKQPLKYYKECIDQAVKAGNDVILSCGQGGSIAILLQKLKLANAVFITNTDGIEHKRTKWNWFVRMGVRLVGELLSVIVSDYLVADSVGIRKYLKRSYPFISQSKLFMIEYGAYISPKLAQADLDKYELRQGEYFLLVSRLEPENNISMILDGYLMSHTSHTSQPLIVVGNLRETDYVKQLLSKSNDKIRFVGGIYDQLVLNSLRCGCTAYLHGHSVGGTNPSLLEALGCGNIVIGHDNVFNREVTNNEMFYFKTATECAKQIDTVASMTAKTRDKYKAMAIKRITDYYNWERIAGEYMKMFEICMKK